MLVLFSCAAPPPPRMHVPPAFIEFLFYQMKFSTRLYINIVQRYSILYFTYNKYMNEIENKVSMPMWCNCFIK